MSLNIPVVLGSVREVRNSYFPAKFMVEKLKEAGVETQLVDFRELPLPFVDSPVEPSDYEKKYPNPNVQKWSNIADAAHAFVLMVSEYNHGYTAVLKNALDWLYYEFERKPFGLVGVSNGKYGGLRAIEQIRPIIENFNGFAIRETVPFGPAQNIFDKDGKLVDESYLKRVNGLIKSLTWSAEAMKTARAASTKY
jgi:NAD(P)H-dependent FMN reductase